MSDLLNQLNQEQLSIYKDLLRDYNNGQVRDIGWYSYISSTLIDMGVDESLAHELAESISDYTE